MIKGNSYIQQQSNTPEEGLRLNVGTGVQIDILLEISKFHRHNPVLALKFPP